MNEPIDYKQLIANLKAGGERREKAIERLYPKLSRKLLSYFEGMGRDRQTAEDLFHTTMVQVLRYIGSFRGDTEGQLWAWIWQIARNEMVQYWRAAARREEPRESEKLEMLWEASDVYRPTPAARRKDAEKDDEKELDGPAEVLGISDTKDQYFAMQSHPLKATLSGELIECLRAALGCLTRRSPAYAEALRLFYWCEWSHAEIAPHLGRKESAMRQFMYEARKRLAPFVEPCNECWEDAAS